MFKYVVLGSALFIASCAAFFSVTGIAQLFSGHMIAAMLMAISLEIGKIVTVSLLYRYRIDMSRTLKFGLSGMLAMLVMITSFGIYAYLSSSYADSASGIKGKENNITLYASQKSNIDSDITRLSQRSSQLQLSRTQQENRLDSLIAKGRSTITQQSIIRSQDAEIVDIQKQIRSLSSTRDSLSSQVVSTTNSLSTEGKLGTFYYVSKSIGVPLDTIVKWFILIIIIVFDPLSVSLFFGYNVILKKELTGEIARDDENKARSPSDMFNSLEEPVHTNEPTTGKDALYEIEPLAKQQNNIVELNTTPYYMAADYDWKHDDRWHSDQAAHMYLSRLGMNPNA